MEFNKWLKRKYPVNYNLILENFAEKDLKFWIKEQGYQVGILTYSEQKGKICLGKCSKEYSWEEWNGLYDQSHTSDTWTGYWDCRYFLTDMEQHRTESKLWEYLKE